VQEGARHADRGGQPLGGSTRALARQRQDLILAEVRHRGAVRVSDLTVRLGVSDMTIRRDLDVLASAGLVEKVHGGATFADQRSTDEPGFEAKSHRETEQKRAIAQAAAALVRPGTAIAVTAGTTTWQLAYHLLDVPDLIVVTNSIRIAEVLHQGARSDQTVVLTGGVRTPSDALVGPVALAALRSLHVDQVFMGVHGMSERAGFTTPNLVEAETNRAFVEAGQRLIILADHTKWGLRGLSTIVALRDAHVVVSDTGLDPEARATIESFETQLIVADPNAARAPSPTVAHRSTATTRAAALVDDSRRTS
jgi:DeoR/GlpR family transcriptional regulator of sugar metabolism